MTIIALIGIANFKEIRQDKRITYVAQIENGWKTKIAETMSHTGDEESPQALHHE